MLQLPRVGGGFPLSEGCNLFAEAANFRVDLLQLKLRCGGSDALPRGVELRVPADVLGAAPVDDEGALLFRCSLCFFRISDADPRYVALGPAPFALW